MAVLASNTVLEGFTPWGLGPAAQFAVTIVGQNFNLVPSYDIITFSLFLANLDVGFGGDPAPNGTLFLALYATNPSGHPTGPILALDSISQSALTSIDNTPDIVNGVGAQWFSFDLSGPTLDANTKYTVALTATDGIPSHYSAVYYNTGLFLQGNAVRFINSVWADQGSADILFQLNGTEIIPRDPARPDSDLPGFPIDRPDDYDPDLIWVPGEWDGDTYTEPEWGDPSRYFATGGGQWGQQLVAVGNGKVYYEELADA